MIKDGPAGTAGIPSYFSYSSSPQYRYFPKNPNSPLFSDILDHPHFRELVFKPDSVIATFSAAHDFFDGSLYLIDTPGHMPGHLGALAHTGNDEWVFMGGDCCHHRALLLD